MAAGAARAADRAARGAGLSLARAPACPLRDSLHQHRRAGLGRGRHAALARADSAALAVLALTCALAALARPEVRVSVPSEQASIALVLDESGSMSAEDVKPTRLAAAQEAVRRFLDRVPSKYRVGLITFSSEPYVDSPLTHDRQLVLDGLQFGTIYGQGTAIGDAIARSVELLQPMRPMATARPRRRHRSSRATRTGRCSAILLLSDGAQTRGTLAAARGRRPRQVVRDPGLHRRARHAERRHQPRRVPRPVPPDPITLRQIAQRTGGEFFATQDESHLNAVYEDLASRLGQKKEWRELSFALLGARRAARPRRRRALAAVGSAAPMRAVALIALAGRSASRSPAAATARRRGRRAQ